MMKTRQPIANDVTPSLIRKVSRGMRPMSLLLDQMNGHYEGSVLDMNSQMTGTFNSGGECPDRDKRLSVFNLQHMGKTQYDCVPRMPADVEMSSEKEANAPKQLCKEKSDSCDRRIKQQCPSAVSESNMPTNPQSHPRISRISLKVNCILSS